MFGPFTSQQATSVYDKAHCIVFIPDGRVLALAANVPHPKWTCSLTVVVRNDEFHSGNGIEALKKEFMDKLGVNLEKAKGTLSSILTFRSSENRFAPLHRVYEFNPIGNMRVSLRKGTLIKAITLKEVAWQLIHELEYTSEIVIKKLVQINKIGGSYARPNF